MSCGIYVPNSFVLPIPKMERQSCSYDWVYALKVLFNLTAPALLCQCAVHTFVFRQLFELARGDSLRCGLRTYSRRHSTSCLSPTAYAAFIDGFMSRVIFSAL